MEKERAGLIQEIDRVDPYMNVDAGTMAREYSRPKNEESANAPGQLPSMPIAETLSEIRSTLIVQRHGEVFVLDDGGEVDLDLGN